MIWLHDNSGDTSINRKMNVCHVWCEYDVHSKVMSLIYDLKINYCIFVRLQRRVLVYKYLLPTSWRTKIVIWGNYVKQLNIRIMEEEKIRIWGNCRQHLNIYIMKNKMGISWNYMIQWKTKYATLFRMVPKTYHCPNGSEI